MDNHSTTQPTADNAITSDMSSMALNKTTEISTEKSSLTGITIPLKNISASEQGQVNVHLTIKDSLNKTESRTPQVQPVFPDLLQRLQTQLTAHYTETSFVNKRLFDTDYFSLADYFVNLQVVVKAYERNEVTQSNDDRRSHKPLRTRDRLAGKKETIAPSDLFQPSAYQDANGKPPASIDTVVVSGAAGVGKTTLMDYIAYQWALFKQGAGTEGLWSNFETVLIVRCRDLQPKALGLGTKKRDIAELLCCTCWGQLDIHLDEARQLLSTLKSAPKSCLLLLDGLDELPVPKKTYWRNLLVQLFQLPFKKLVTTRPYAIGNLQQWLSHDGLVEIQGFSDEDVPTFFKKHLGATEPTNNFIKDIKRNPDLWAIAHIPINAYLLKVWWETTYQQDKSVLLSEMSVSSLYESLMVNVCRRYLAKIGELDENKLLDDELVLEVPSIRCLLDTLGCWAFEGLRQDTAQLPIRWLKGVQGSDESPTLLSANRLKQLNVPTLKALGLLKQVGHAIRAQQRYEFLHLSFQEFLAANVIAVTLREGAEEQKVHLTQVIHKYKYHPNFTLVWPSVAGLLSRYPTVLDDFLWILVAGPKDWVGIVEFDLLMRCLASSLPSNTDTNALGLRQQTLLRAVKQRIKRFNELPQRWQQAIINTLSMCPKLIRLNANTVWAFLRNEAVNNSFRCKLASSAIAHLSPTPECVYTVLALLRDEMVINYVRRDLARDTVVHLSKTPECADAAWGFFWDETVDYYVRGALAKSAAAHLSKTPEFSDAVLASLRDKTVEGYVRVKLARCTVAHLPQTPELMDAVWALLRDETVGDYFLSELAISVVTCLSQNPEYVNAAWVFLRDETVSDYVRGQLAKSAVVHLSPTPEFVDAILAFLQDETVSVYVRGELAKSAVAHLPPTSELLDTVWTLLRNETVEDYVRGDLAKNAAEHLPPTPELMDAILAFLRDEQADEYVRVKLIRDTVSLLSQNPELMDAILPFLRDETVSSSVRVALTSSTAVHLSQTPELVDVVLAFLRDKKVKDFFHSHLARSTVAYLLQTPELVDAVLTLLRDETVSDSVRFELARGTAEHFSQTPKCVDAVLVLLRDEMVKGYVRVELAISAVAHLPHLPELVDTVLTLLQAETVNYSIRGKLARSAVAHFSQIPRFVDAVWALFRNKNVSKYVRSELVDSAVVHFSQAPECADAVWALLRDETVSDSARSKLARNAVAHLSQTPELVDTVLTLLRDEMVSDSVRCELARSTVEHFSQTPKCVDAVLTFLRNEKVSDYVRCKLARNATQLLPKQPNKTQAFLDILFVKGSAEDDLSQRADIPVHLLLPLYKKTHDKGRQYIREQLVKHGVLVYEQAGTVLVTQAGQTERLTLPPPLIQQIQKDLQSYRINIDDSVSTISKSNLFSKSAMSSFSSQHTEKRSDQISHNNIGQVMQ